MIELFSEPNWINLLIIGLTLTASMGFGAFALVKTGHSPLWALILLVPVAVVVGLWVLAYKRWPRIDGDPAG
jgi:hypothetical protein